MKAGGPRLGGAATSAGTDEGRAGRVFYLCRRRGSGELGEDHQVPSPSCDVAIERLPQTRINRSMQAESITTPSHRPPAPLVVPF